VREEKGGGKSGGPEHSLWGWANGDNTKPLIHGRAPGYQYKEDVEGKIEERVRRGGSKCRENGQV